MSKKVLTHGSLFAGIGGFDLGFERAGIKTVWQVEIDPFCRAVLAKNFPEAERFEDVRVVGRNNLHQVDIITGGFPCQDISTAGRRAGINGKRSGLWQEMRRIICELRPRFAVVENVSALLGLGLCRVLGDLAESGYDAEWDCLPAIAFGAHHRRDRVFLVAYHASSGNRESQSSLSRADERLSRLKESSADAVGCGQDMADSTRQRFPHIQGRGQVSKCTGVRTISDSGWWNSEPDVGRVAHGIPSRVDRLKGLGNAVVPQIAEWIGKRLVEFE